MCALYRTIGINKTGFIESTTITHFHDVNVFHFNLFHRFKKFLELLLMVGNYMNSGSRNAQTLGFDISYLTRVKRALEQLVFVKLKYALRG